MQSMDHQQEIEDFQDKVGVAIKNMRSPLRHYPRCPECPLSKDMSLVCLNKDCGEGNYFQLICPYCHRQQHQMHQLKVEDDLDIILQVIEDHTRERLMTKQVSVQDIDFIDTLLDSQKSLNMLLNKIQQVKFILDDTLAGYKRRMYEYEEVIRLTNNAQNSSSQQIINEQLRAINKKIQYRMTESGAQYDWVFEQEYAEEKERREEFGQQCLIAIDHSWKSFKNLVKQIILSTKQRNQQYHIFN